MKVYLENNGGKLILVPNLDIPEASSAGDISALIEGPNSIPTPVVDVFILPGQYKVSQILLALIEC